jgi:hypothetical protein
MLIKHQRGESYQHAAARTVFVEWLRIKCGHFGPFMWRSDNGAVYEEFPFIKDISEPIGHSWAYNQLEWIYKHKLIEIKNPPIPSYDELIAADVYPIAIADVAIEHKGMIVYAIEIVHKNDISEEKIAKLLKLNACVGLEIWRVEAHWILSQIGLPNSFPEECIRRVG